MSVRIYTMTHKKFIPPSDTMYIPLQVGRVNAADLGFLGDDTGNHISHKNCYYSELTGLYWIWKNVNDVNYAGLCHYRRYPLNQEGSMLREEEIEKILLEYDIITSKRISLNFSYAYGYGENHNPIDLQVTGEVISELYPEYYPVFEKLVHEKQTYFGNIMITSKKLFDEYAQWLFSIFFQVEKRIDVSSYDEYHKRVFGFISEFLLYVWVTAKKLKPYECMIGMIAEKFETKEIKKRLAEYFKVRKIEEAKNYFMEFIKKRPDVLMEAADETGEIKLAMQAIVTFDHEYATYGHSLLDQVDDFSALMLIYRKLNLLILKCAQAQNTLSEEIEFLKKYRISKIAIEVGVRVMSQDFLQEVPLDKVINKVERRLAE